MGDQRIVEQAIRKAQGLLRDDLPVSRSLPNAIMVERMRELIRSGEVRSALGSSSDTIFAFTLRGIRRALADQSRSDKVIVGELWAILDDPILDAALGIKKGFRPSISFQRPPRASPI
jgi:hypothetical protein